MRRFIIFVLLVGCTQAEPGWNPATLYTYQVLSLSSVTVDIQNRVHQGVMMKGTLNLQTGLPSPWTLSGNLTDLQYTEFNETPLNECSSPTNNLIWKSMNTSNSTFAIMLNGGVVEKLVLNNNLSTWEANYIRSLVTQLQINVPGSTMDNMENDYQGSDAINVSLMQYSTMEESFIGHCEVLYDISRMSTSILENEPTIAPLFNLSEDNEGVLIDIVKVQNFSNCKQHIVYHKGMNAEENWDAGLSKLGDVIKRTVAARMILNGTLNNYTLHSSVSSDQMLVSPSLYKNEQILIRNCMNLTLHEVQQSDITLPSTDGKESNLLFDYEFKTENNIDSIQDSGNQSRNTRHVHYKSINSKEKMYKYRKVRGAGTSDENTSSTNEEESPLTTPYPTDSTISSIESTVTESTSTDTDISERSTTEHIAGTTEVNATTSTASIPYVSTSEGLENSSKEMANSQDTNSTKHGGSSETISQTSSEHSIFNDNVNMTTVLQMLNISKDLERPKLSSLFSIYQSFKNISDKNHEDIQNAIKDISQELGNQLKDFESIINKNTLYTFSELSQLIANAEYEVLHNVSNMLHQLVVSDVAEHQMPWIVFRDAVAHAGNGPSLMLIKEWIIFNKTTNEEASEILGTLPYSVEIPNEEYIDTLFNMVKHPQISQKESINVTILLTFSKIICNAFVDVQSQKAHHPVHIFSPLIEDSTKLKTMFLPYLESKLHEAIQQNDSKNVHTYVRALGNVAHPQILNTFAHYMKEGTNISSFTKQWMVICLDKVMELHPKETRNYLYSLFIDGQKHPDIRTAAVILIIKSKPPVNLLQKIAELSKYDTNDQVIAAVQSAIHSAAQLTDPKNSKFKESAKLAIPLLNTKELGIQHSHLVFKNSDLHELGKLRFESSMNYFGSENHIMPNGLFINYERFLGGLQTGKEKFGVLLSDMKKFNVIFEKIWDVTQQTMSNSLKNITENEADKNDRLNAILLLQLAKHEKFLTFDQDNFSVLSYVRQILKSMKVGHTMNYTKLFNRDTFVVSVPNVAGHITQVVYKVPSVLKVTGKVKLNMKQSQSSESSKKLVPDNTNFSGALNFGYSFNKFSNIGFITLYNGNRYISGYKEQLLFNLRMKANVTTSLQDMWRESEISLSPYSPDSPGIYGQFNSESYRQNDNIYNIVQNRSSGLQITTQQQPYKQKTIQYGSMHLYINEENTRYEDIPSQQNEDNDIYSILDFPSSQNSMQNNNITLKIKFPSEVNCVSLKSRYANLKTKRPESKKSNRQSKQKNFQDNTNQENAESIMQWSLLLNKNSNPTYASDINYSWDQHSNKTNLKVSLYQNSQEQLTLNVDGNWVKIGTFNSSKDLVRNPKSEVSALLHLGSTKAPVVSMECKMQRTPERFRFMMNQSETLDCLEQMQHGNMILPSCQNTLEKANYLDQHNCSIRIKDLEKGNKLYQKVFRVLHTYMYDYFTCNPQNQKVPSNTVSFNVQFSPSYDSANVFLLLPNAQAMVKNISIPPFLKPIVEVNPSNSAITRLAQTYLAKQYNPTCVLDKNKINTFDNKTYSVQLLSCWYVLMAVSLETSSKSFLKENDILILTRDKNEGRDVRLLIGDTVVDITAHSSSKQNSEMYLHINNEQYPLYQGKLTDISFNDAVNFTMQGTVEDEKLKLVLNNNSLNIVFDGLRLMILTKNRYRNQTLGLCGNFNGNDLDDFTVPNRKCKIRDSSLFTGSYAIVSNNTCSGEALEGVQKAINMTCSATHDLHVYADFPHTRNTSPLQCGNNEPDPRCVKSNIRVLKEHKQTCFSQTNIPECKDSCNPIKIVRKKINFHCVTSSTASSQIEKAIIAGNKVDFSQKKRSKQVILDIPSGCYKC